MKKKDLWPILLIAAALVFVFFDFFTLESAFLSGDHREQQYPWAKFYQQEIRSGHLPWWTSQIHSGFPLLAEGQIGAFYPLNFLFFYFLPVKAAYNYIILFQYFLGGLFFYVYLRRLKISEWGAFFAALIYLFGSTQGGYFYYNYISQKTVLWLPLALILIDRILKYQRPVDAGWLGLVFAIQIFAGYLQIAVYSVFFSIVYFFLSLRGTLDKRRSVLLLALSGFLMLIISAVQLLPTLELAKLSVRAAAPAGLAYVGSMLPIGFLTLVYPSWDGFLGSEWYLGLPGLFCFASIFLYRKGTTEKKFLILVGLFLLLALGGYSPLYRPIVELSGFQAFRTPIKFLFFTTFSCAVLAGFGFDRLFNGAPEDSILFRKTRKFFFTGIILLLTLPVFTHFILLAGKDRLLPHFQNAVVLQFHGKAGHPHSEVQYRQKASDFYDFVTSAISLKDKATKRQFFLALLSLFILSWVFRTGKFAQVFFTGLLCVDLFNYGFTSIRGGIEPFRSIDDVRETGKIASYLKSQPGLFRVSEVPGDVSGLRQIPFYPNSNMLSGISSIGAYTPLIIKKYGDFLGRWGYINDSISLNLPSQEQIAEHLHELSLLNVVFFLSSSPLDVQGLTLVMKDAGAFLYRNSGSYPRAFFTTQTGDMPRFQDLVPEPVAEVKIVDYRNTFVEIDAKVPGKGTLVLTDMAYPGWKAWVNDAEVRIDKPGGLFRAIALEKGNSRIRFRYEPRFYQALGFLSLLTVLTLVFATFWPRLRSKPSPERIA